MHVYTLCLLGDRPKMTGAIAEKHPSEVLTVNKHRSKCTYTLHVVGSSGNMIDVHTKTSPQPILFMTHTTRKINYLYVSSVC